MHEIELLRTHQKEQGISLQPAFDKQLTELHALACLRTGEQQNCLSNHNAQSCVYPIRDGGVHLNRVGAECAVQQWSSLLRDGKGSLIDKWLLNIAWSTLGGPPPMTSRWKSV